MEGHRIPTYHVTYTYSEKTYDDQKVVLEQNTAIHEEGSSDSYGNVPEYKESFLKQKSIQKVERNWKMERKTIEKIEETKARYPY